MATSDTWVTTSNLAALTVSQPIVLNGGMSAGGWYGGGCGTATIPTYFPTTTTTTSTNPFILTPQTRLRPDQLTMLLSNHRFIEMDQGGFCLFCFALDLHRTQNEHDFMIREE